MKAKIWDDPATRFVNILCMYTDSGLYDFNSNEIVTLRIGEQIQQKSLLKLPREVYECIAKEIKKDESIPNVDRMFAEGKLEATEKHLEDMRTLVFKNTLGPS